MGEWATFLENAYLFVSSKASQAEDVLTALMSSSTNWKKHVPVFTLFPNYIFPIPVWPVIGFYWKNNEKKEFENRALVR